jgi:hypothetical protein
MPAPVIPDFPLDVLWGPGRLMRSDMVVGEPVDDIPPAPDRVPIPDIPVPPDMAAGD